MSHQLDFATLRRAMRLWDSEYATPQQRRANALKWLRAVHQLGDRWLLAQPKEQQQ